MSEIIKKGDVIGHRIDFAGQGHAYTRKGEKRALKMVAAKFGLTLEQIAWSDAEDEEAILVWASEGDQRGDDGQMAIAKITAKRASVTYRLN